MDFKHAFDSLTAVGILVSLAIGALPVLYCFWIARKGIVKRHIQLKYRPMFYTGKEFGYRPPLRELEYKGAAALAMGIVYAVVGVVLLLVPLAVYLLFLASGRSRAAL